MNRDDNPDVLIIGAGVAGISAATYVSGQGFSCLVVEKESFPGGRAAGFSCKATDSCAKCNACLLEKSLEESLREAPSSSTPTWLYQTSVQSIEEQPGGFEAVLHRAPVYVDPAKCVDCGLCYNACPEAGKAVCRAPVPVSSTAHAINGKYCLQVQGKDCRACQDVCPERAIDFSASAIEETVQVKAVILAVGYEPFDPLKKARYGYGRFENVISALELDRDLRESGNLVRLSNGARPTRTAFIQCVGSRDRSLGRDYCSRICCGYAMRMARSIKYRWPDMAVSMFYMDLQNTGRDFTRYHQELSREVELISGVPGEISAGENGSLLLPFMDPETGLKTTREYDLVVLSIGLGPPEVGWAKGLPGIGTTTDGFIQGDPDKGLFIAGTAGGPMNIAESRASALGAAAKAVSYLTVT